MLRLAVFMTHPPIPSTLEETTGDNEPFYWWGVSSLEWLAQHGHATLSGGTFSLIEGDLRLLGGLVRSDQPGGTAIRGLPGLPDVCVPPRLPGGQLRGLLRFPGSTRSTGEVSGCSIRPTDQLSQLPTTSLDQLLARVPPRSGTARGPAGMLDHRVLAGRARHDRRRN